MSRIEWTEKTWNPLIGCSHASPGCDNCYAALMSWRLGNMGQEQYVGIATKSKGKPADFTGEVRLRPELVDAPLSWWKPRMVFVNSMSDLFHRDVPAEFIARVFSTMDGSRRHTFQVLTKRPQRMADVLDHGGDVRLILDEVRDDLRTLAGEPITEDDYAWPLPNVWLGTSIEDDRYTFRADHLRATPAAVRFLSCEPLIGPLPSLNLTGIDWVIVGGESGPRARPMELAWAVDLVDRCIEAGVAVFVKQLGTVLAKQLGLPGKGDRFDDLPESVRVRAYPGGVR